MDYEKAYKEALNRAKHALDCHNQGMVSTDVSLITSMFPELKESEDEKIRKGLIKGLSAMRDIHHHQTFSDDAININEALAWLEKQGESKPFDYESANIQQKDFAPINVTDEGIVEAIKNTSVLDMIEQKQEWSIEESYINNAIAACRSLYGEYSETAHWLESLKERLQPKQAWSEEDEEMFDFCCNYLDDNQIAFLERLKARVQGKEE